MCVRKMRRCIGAAIFSVFVVLTSQANALESFYDKADLATAFEGCEHENVNACWRVWEFYAEGEAESEYLQPARPVFARECGKEEYSLCYQYGVMLRDGLAGPKDLAGAEQALEKACVVETRDNEDWGDEYAAWGLEEEEAWKTTWCDALDAVKHQRSGQPE